MIAAGELSNLKGMLYLTDGCGQFPSMPPSYEAAFVMPPEAADEAKLPPWAIKVVLDMDALCENVKVLEENR